MNEIERAIALFESSYNPEDATTEYSKLKQQVFAIAIEALKEKLERENDIVHCKDCKHLGIKDFIYGYCKRDMSGQVQPDDYCSRGVRRKERSNERDRITCVPTYPMPRAGCDTVYQRDKGNHQGTQATGSRERAAGNGGG